MNGYSTMESSGAPPAERDSSDSDGSPERSSGLCRARLVADDTEPFEELKTGISLVCNPTGKEIRTCLRKAGLSHEGIFYCFACCFGIVGISQILLPSSTVSLPLFYRIWWLIFAAVFLVLSVFENRTLVKEYRQSVADRLEIYPDHIEVKRNGAELPLDGTGELVCTRNDYTLVFPTAENSGKQHRPRFLIVPLRCVEAGVLPYVEAMLVAGTKPRR